MDKDKEITFRRYLILRILKENNNNTVYWLKAQMFKEGYSVSYRQLYRIISRMKKDKIIDYSKGNKKNRYNKDTRLVFITEKGIKEFLKLNLKMRLLINKISQ